MLLGMSMLFGSVIFITLAVNFVFDNSTQAMNFIKEINWQRAIIAYLLIIILLSVLIKPK